MAKDILVVEDEKISLLFLTHHLQELGHRVVGCATTGDDAIDQAAKYLPDLVVMDVGLKGAMSGVEAANVIVERLQIPILFTSAYTKEEICRQERIPKISEYLEKPFLSEDLQAAIERLFSRGDDVDSQS